ncbi:CUB and sushi domain-containing protein 1 [Myotis davidii]|uniref:CUB and sushi domain-containing protein 1 n=1 Tax=Myotis davidii TaxID=225400 RepID=L5LQ21_MYODS|nr:CUB and sushi domain-containing protein 1 [Myotis davidii]
MNLCPRVRDFLLLAVSLQVSRARATGPACIAHVRPPPVTCPGIEGQLAEHVTWRLVSGAPNEFGTQVVLSCSPGHYLEGSRLLRCQAYGTWSTSFLGANTMHSFVPFSTL